VTSRTARLHVPGGVFHVISRCPGGEPLLEIAGAREKYLELLGSALEATDARLLAYCLMSNHVHLVLIRGEQPLERVVKSVHTGLGRFLSPRRPGRGAKGPVFADRPRMVLVQEETYLRELVRYVHNNPVRAGLVRQASASAWTSHRAYVGRVEAPEWLNVGYVLDRFGRGARAREGFERFVAEGKKEAPRLDLLGEGRARAQTRVSESLGDGYRVSDGIVGDDTFVRRVLRDVAKAEGALSSGTVSRGRTELAGKVSAADVVREACERSALEPWALEAGGRTRVGMRVRVLATWVWVYHLGQKQVDLARELQATTSMVSRWLGVAVRAAPELEADASLVLRRLKRRARAGFKPAQSTGVRHSVRSEE
jgi:putative transposase